MEEEEEDGGSSEEAQGQPWSPQQKDLLPVMDPRLAKMVPQPACHPRNAHKSKVPPTGHQLAFEPIGLSVEGVLRSPNA
jgi:hypothetical protein